LFPVGCHSILMPAHIVIILASSSRCVGRVISSVCDCVFVCMSVHTLKEKRLELSTPSYTMFSRNSLNRFVILGTNCLHDLLPPARDPSVSVHLRHPTAYPILHVQRKRYCFFMNNTKLGIHSILCDKSSACIDPEVKRSKVTGL